MLMFYGVLFCHPSLTLPVVLMPKSGRGSDKSLGGGREETPGGMRQVMELIPSSKGEMC